MDLEARVAALELEMAEVRRLLDLILTDPRMRRITATRRAADPNLELLTARVNQLEGMTRAFGQIAQLPPESEPETSR